MTSIKPNSPPEIPLSKLSVRSYVPVKEKPHTIILTDKTRIRHIDYTKKFDRRVIRLLNESNKDFMVSLKTKSNPVEFTVTANDKKIEKEYLTEIVKVVIKQVNI